MKKKKLNDLELTERLLEQMVENVEKHPDTVEEKVQEVYDDLQT